MSRSFHRWSWSILVIAIVLAGFTLSALINPPASQAQFIDRIVRPCAAGIVPLASVIVNPNNTGNINVTPCTGGTLTINGVPVTTGGITGSGLATQVAFFTGASVIAGDPGMTYDSGTNTLTVDALNVGTITLTATIIFPDGVRQTFNPNGTTPGLNVGSQAGDPSTPTNGDLWYDLTGNLLRARINGATVSLGATSFANPSASLGLTAVNGVATTAMRSDAAPALSQSIAPTWTGLHTWLNVPPTLERNDGGLSDLIFKWSRPGLGQTLSGDNIAHIGAIAVDNAETYSSITNAPGIRIQAAENWTATARGTLLQFITTTVGGTTNGVRGDVTNLGLRLGAQQYTGGAVVSSPDVGWRRSAAARWEITDGAVSGIGGSLDLKDALFTQGTLVASTPFINHTATWNNVAVTFTNILSNVVITNSTSGSLLIDLQVGGTSKFKVDKFGSITSANSATLGTAGVLTFGIWSKIQNQDCDGCILISNNAVNNFNRLQFGGTSSSFPALKRSTTSLQMRLADDSADAPLTVSNLTASGFLSGATYSTATNCADSAGAAACGSAAAGAVVIDAGATSVVVSTTAVTANSEVFVMFDASLGTRLGVTCNTTVALPTVTARIAATSFTITVPSAPVTNPACYGYYIIN